MDYLADPGGRFASDTHRRVLGHLAPPGDSVGWTAESLLYRMIPDVGTQITDVEEVSAVLSTLVADGDAEEITVPGEDGTDKVVYRQTQQGFELLTGPIANEPPPGAVPEGPAQIGASVTIPGPTTIPEGNGAADNAS